MYSQANVVLLACSIFEISTLKRAMIFLLSFRITFALEQREFVILSSERFEPNAPDNAALPHRSH